MRPTLIVAALAFAFCTVPGPNTKAAHDAMSGDGLLAHTKGLASDEFEGRGPGTPGEDRTVKYLEEQLKAMGLEPGNPDGTYVQNVPLVGIRSTVSGAITTPRGKVALNQLKDYD